MVTIFQEVMNDCEHLFRELWKDWKVGIEKEEDKFGGSKRGKKGRQIGEKKVRGERKILKIENAWKEREW